jgi:hypothetical protein
MPDTDRTLGMYLHLARASHVRRQAMVRDKLLVLAGVQAQEMGLKTVAADCRTKILAHNGHHLLRQWPTLDSALADEHFLAYLKQLKRRYSPEKIEHMLASLGIELGREREAYFSDLEYATALLEAVPQDFDNRSKHSSAGSTTSQTTPGRAALEVPRRPLVSFLVVWGPFLAGLFVLAALAVVSRALGGWQL